MTEVFKETIMKQILENQLAILDILKLVILPNELEGTTMMTAVRNSNIILGLMDKDDENNEDEAK